MPLLITPYDLFYGTSDKYHIDILYRVLFLLRNLLAVVECFRCRSEVSSQDARLFLGAFAKQMQNSNSSICLFDCMFNCLSVRMEKSHSDTFDFRVVSHLRFLLKCMGTLRFFKSDKNNRNFRDSAVIWLSN